MLLPGQYFIYHNVDVMPTFSIHNLFSDGKKEKGWLGTDGVERVGRVDWPEDILRTNLIYR